MGWIRIFLSSFLAIILSQLVCFVWDPNQKVALQTLAAEKHPTSASLSQHSDLRHPVLVCKTRWEHSSKCFHVPSTVFARICWEVYVNDSPILCLNALVNAPTCWWFGMQVYAEIMRRHPKQVLKAGTMQDRPWTYERQLVAILKKGKSSSS